MSEEYSQFQEKMLSRRGINTADAARRFLSPDYERDIHDPFLMKDMDRAVERVSRAVALSEHIAIYADYDCDGIPAAVILHDFFKKIGHKQLMVYIPHRTNEGFGLNVGAVEQLAEAGVSLVVTVDCGITDITEITRANKLGVDVIITDHHLPVLDKDSNTERLPSAYAVLDPKRAAETYPFEELCGAGIAFKLVQALLKDGAERWQIMGGWEKWLLDMAGLATIADMVPLVDENRAFAHFGLKVLRKSPRPGLQQLLRAAEAKQQFLTEEDIGFTIAPRVNAASRMGEPRDAFELLSTTDPRLGGTLALGLHRLNDRRKGLVASMVKEAHQKLRERDQGASPCEVIVVGNTDWMPGLVGLAANALMETYRRPVFVWGRSGGEVIKGSCRSDGSVNVVRLMAAVSAGVFLDFGGHELSGGFSVSPEGIHTFEHSLLSALALLRQADDGQDTAGSVGVGKGSPRVAGEAGSEVDATLLLEDVCWETYEQIEALAPFGVGNPKPIFLFEHVSVFEVRRFGRDRNHLELCFKNRADSKLSAIGFFADKFLAGREVAAGETIDLIASFEKSYYRNMPELRLRIVEII